MEKAPSTIFSENACARVTSAHNTSDLADNYPAKSCDKALILQSSVQIIPSAIDVKSSNSTATLNSSDINKDLLDSLNIKCKSDGPPQIVHY